MRNTAGCVGLSTLLEGTKYFSSSLSIDKLFALYGLARDRTSTDGTMALNPDYSKPMVTSLCDVAVYLITRASSLGAVLRQIYHSQHRMQGLPSWVPDWTQGNSDAALDSFTSTYRASASESAKPSWPRKPNILEIDGLLVDRVSRIGLPPLTPMYQYGIDNDNETGPVYTFQGTHSFSWLYGGLSAGLQPSGNPSHFL